MSVLDNYFNYFVHFLIQRKGYEITLTKSSTIPLQVNRKWVSGKYWAPN